MKANVGDRLVVEGTHLDEPRRVGVITEVRHPDGSPPYLVRWLDTEHVALVYPGPGARIESRSDAHYQDAHYQGPHGLGAAERAGR